MSSVKWWRVIDPLNPLCGCDVMIEDLTHEAGFFAVKGLRRMDVLMGDRPFQLINKDGNVGVMVNFEHLVPSPIQDDVVEIGYDYPNGKCLDEELLCVEEVELRIVRYENAIQVAYGEQEGELYASCMLRGDDRETRLDAIIAEFQSDRDNYDEIVATIKREGR